MSSTKGSDAVTGMIISLTHTGLIYIADSICPSWSYITLFSWRQRRWLPDPNRTPETSSKETWKANRWSSNLWYRNFSHELFIIATAGTSDSRTIKRSKNKDAIAGKPYRFLSRFCTDMGLHITTQANQVASVERPLRHPQSARNG